MIEKINIYNYRGIEDFNITFDSFTLIYGENSIGKTRIITFIRDLLNFKDNVSGLVVLKLNTSFLEFNLEIIEEEVKHFSLRYKNISKKYKKIINTKDNVVSNEKSKFIFNPSVKTFLSLFSTINITQEERVDIIDILTSVDYYLEDDELLETYIDKIRYYSAKDIKKDDFISELPFFTFKKYQVEWYTNIEKKLNEVLKRLDNNFKNFNLNIAEVKEDELYKIKSHEYILKNGEIYNLDDEENNVKISRGLRKFVKIYIKILKFIESDDTVLIMDEIDAYIHDELYKNIIKQVINFVKTNINKQIIVISHNIETLNFVDRNYIRIIKNDPDLDQIYVSLIRGKKFTTSSNITKIQRKFNDELEIKNINFFE